MRVFALIQKILRQYKCAKTAIAVVGHNGSPIGTELRLLEEIVRILAAFVSLWRIAIY